MFCLLSHSYADQDFVKLCTEEFLEERAYYRRTGVKAKERKKDAILWSTELNLCLLFSHHCWKSLFHGQD